MLHGRIYPCALTALALAIAAVLTPAAAAPLPQTAAVSAPSTSAQPATTQADQAGTQSKHKALTAKQKAKRAAKKNAVDLSGVTVHPILFSLESAQEQQRESEDQIEVIVAGDVGKFPDNDVAAALSHVSGLQVTYLQGQANNVTLRGLPDVATTLNGRRFFSTTSRNFNFADMPADALSSVEVYKSVSANLPEGGISGLINVKTRKPFDYKGLKAEAQVKEEHSQINGSYAPDANVFLSDRWHTGLGDVGALVSAQYYQNKFIRIRSYNSNRNTYTNKQTGETILIPSILYTQNEKGQRTRQSMNYDLQWKPINHLVVEAGGFYAKEYIDDSTEEFEIAPRQSKSSDNLMTYGPSTPGGCATSTPGLNQCSLYSGTFNSPEAYSYTSTRPKAGNRFSVGQYWLGANWKSGSLTVDSSVAATHTNTLETEYESQTGLTDPGLSGPTVVNVNLQGPGGKPVYDLVGNPQLNKDAYVLRSFEPIVAPASALDWSWKTDLSYFIEHGFIQRIDAGFVYSYTKASAAEYGAHSGKGNSKVSVESILPGFMALSPDLGGYLTPGQYYAPNAGYLVDNAQALEALVGLPVGVQDVVPTDVFHDRERELAAYLQASYDFNLGEVPVEGLFGVREVKTQRYLLSNKVVNKVVSPIANARQTYTALPNISANLHLTEDLQLRLSAAKTLSEPSFSDLNPATTLTIPVAKPGEPPVEATGSGGNPDLLPIRSTNFDSTLAWYFSRSSSVSLAAFYHKLHGFTERYGSDETIDGVTYFVNRPQSAGTGHLKGWEFDYHQFFSFLPAPFNGLGTRLTYAYVLGSTQSPEGATGPTVTPLVGVSKKNYNAEIFYEKHRFSMHLAYQYRSAYVTSLAAGGHQFPQTEFVAGNGRVNFGIDYDVTPHVTVTLGGTNILHSNYRSYFGSKLNPYEYDFRDTTYSLGVRAEL